MGNHMRDIRCDGEFKRPGLGGVCGQLLFRADPEEVQIKCPRCKQIKHIVVAAVVRTQNPSEGMNVRNSYGSD